MLIRSRTAGFTLIELMVGMIVGLIVLSAIIYIFIVSIRSSRDVYRGAVVNNETAFLSDFVTGEIRRIGYTSASTADVSNTFDIVGSNCLVYTYDKDTTTPGMADDNYFAIKSDAGKLYYGVSVAVATCTAASSAWGQLSSDRVTASIAFQSVASAAMPSYQTNLLGYTLTLQWTGDDWSSSISESVAVRNSEKL